MSSHMTRTSRTRSRSARKASARSARQQTTVGNAITCNYYLYSNKFIGTKFNCEGEICVVHVLCVHM
jgi:hypothetical protein